MASAQDVTQFRLYAYFVSVDPAKNRRRFYALTWQPVLWGGGAIVRSWGRVGTEGRSLVAYYQDRAGAQEIVEKMIKRRLKRRYVVVEFK